jgi:hypothetical protein
MALVYGWMNGNVKNDKKDSILFRAIAIIASYLGTVVHVVHVANVANCSVEWSELSNCLEFVHDTRCKITIKIFKGIGSSRSCVRLVAEAK